MADNAVDAVVTDPPYGFAFMGKKWDYDLPPVELWEQALRVLKPGGHLLAFGGARTYHRATCRIEDAGFEIRDCVMWVYGSGFPKSHNLQGEWKGFGTALKPAHEPIVLARKPLIGTVAENVQAWGCGALNVEGCRIGTETIAVTKTAFMKMNGQNGRPWHDGHQDSTSSHQGRWPANIIHDGSEEVAGMFPVTAASTNRPRNNSRGVLKYNGQNARPSHNDGTVATTGDYEDSGSAARFFYAAKASRSEREAGLQDLEAKHRRRDDGQPYGMNTNTHRPDGSERKPVAPSQNHHPTVKPQSLMRYLCRLITPPNGVILDPFFGSGSTGVAAIAEGFSIIGIEQEAEYVEIARRRCEHALGADAPLFAVA